MILYHRISIWYVVVLTILLFVINGVEPKRQNSPGIRRLVEIKTVDDEGVVRARVVAEYKPTDIEKHKTYDDEDSRDVSSGDSEEAYGESYDMVANDEPMAPSSNSSSESSGSQSQDSKSNTNTTSTPVTNPADSKTSTVVPTTGQINASSSSLSTVRVTTSIDATTAVLQTTKPTTTVKVTFTTTGKANVTTRSPSTKDAQTTLPPEVTKVMTELESTTAIIVTLKTTEIKRTTGSNVTKGAPSVNASTTASTNLTNQGINDSTVSITVSTIASAAPNINVQGQNDPDTNSRRRKTLFGFVTVEILIALLAGALFSVLLVAFLVYRLKKRNEGSYELSETIALRPKEMSDMSNKKEVFV